MGTYPDSCYKSPNIVKCSMLWRLYVIIIIDAIIILFDIYELVRSLIQYFKKNEKSNLSRILFWLSNVIFLAYRAATWIFPADSLEDVIIPICMAVPALLIQLPAFFLSWSLYSYTDRLKCTLGNIASKVKIIAYGFWGVLWSGFLIAFIVMYSIGKRTEMGEVSFYCLFFSDLCYAPLILFPCFVNIRVSIEMFPDFSRHCILGTWTFYILFVVCICVRIVWRFLLLVCPDGSGPKLPFTMPVQEPLDPTNLDNYLTAVICYTLFCEWIPLIMPQIGISFLMKRGDERADEISFISWNEWL